MPLSSLPSYRRSTEMAADDMISEGAPLRQPSKAESRATLARASRHAWSRKLQHMFTPTAAFWTGFATGLVVSLMDRRLRVRHSHSPSLPPSAAV